MKHGQIIPYVEKCIPLGNTLNSRSIEHAMLDSVTFFDGSVLTGKFCVVVPLNIQSIYLSRYCYY